MTERRPPAGRSADLRSATLDRFGQATADYTKERPEIFADLDLEELLASIRRQESRPAGDEG